MRVRSNFSNTPLKPPITIKEFPNNSTYVIGASTSAIFVTVIFIVTICLFFCILNFLVTTCAVCKYKKWLLFYYFLLTFKNIYMICTFCLSWSLIAFRTPFIDVVPVSTSFINHCSPLIFRARFRIDMVLKEKELGHPLIAENVSTPLRKNNTNRARLLYTTASLQLIILR